MSSPRASRSSASAPGRSSTHTNAAPIRAAGSISGTPASSCLGDTEDDTDVAAMRDKYITVTPLQFDLTHREMTGKWREKKWELRYAMTDPAKHLPADLRREYTKHALLESNVLPDPIAQFDRWFNDAALGNLTEANAMTLATVDSFGARRPGSSCSKASTAEALSFSPTTTAARVATLRRIRALRCVSSGNRSSGRCGSKASSRRRAARRAKRISTRVPSARRSARGVSQQSEAIESRRRLDRRAEEFLAQFVNTGVPLPEFWGGFRVVPHAIEFWQGRPSACTIDCSTFARGTAGKSAGFALNLIVRCRVPFCSSAPATTTAAASRP